MAFTVQGQIRGMPVTVTYDGGKLQGDAMSLDLASLALKFLEGSKTNVGPPEGPIVTGGYLRDPLATFLALVYTMDDPVATGDIPAIPGQPGDGR